ncbi:tetracycline efflux MFS transporter Tet(V) [Mycolicibacterium fluoranthenivorans]|uniref:DHA3 family tetracycline resistance protein-like MFS transporter n=1 Tax=Mycolicibacterium fluoranthenivorans TaxID=258505 RepID=A0A7X5U547_9MYCO|nr:tetracycline efflux MFS transporter Tet(V) [Mycolicibacterium fluoranthenivorans]NIH98615.1 DHA3 family tetracycline resistance protein-like MFS transporter [Mycolicibacterium fluoranthenivorans]
MTTQLERPRWRVLAPLRHREYRLLIGAVALSIFASGMWTVVMALQVIALDNDPTALSLVATCLSAGLIAFVLVGGIAADRLPQRAIIIAVESVNTAVATAVAVLGLTGQLRLWHMAVGATALGVGAAFFFPAYSAYLPRLLPPEQLLAANGIEGMLRPTMQQAVGPAVAGMLIGATFPSLGAVAVAILYGTGLILLIATRPVAQAVPAERPSTHPLADLRDGFRFMVRTPWLLATLLFASGFVLLIIGPLEVLLPFITNARFAHGERIFGFVLAAFGLGGAVGAIAISSVRLPRRYLTVMVMCWGLGNLPLVAIGYTASFAVMAAAAFVVGMTSTAATVIWGTLLQRRVPPAMLGRVSSLDFFVSLVFMPVSMAVAGPLSKVFAVQTIFLAAGTIPAVLGLIAWLAARMPRDEVAHPLNS